MHEEEQEQAPIRRRRASQSLDGTVTVSGEIAAAKEAPHTEKTHDLSTPPIPINTKDAAYVTVGLGFTKNLGNFESFRGYVSVSLPCDNTKEAVGKTEKRAVKLAESYLEEIRSDMLGDS